MGAAAAAAVRIRKERQLVEHLVARGATDAAHAQSRETLHVEANPTWSRLERLAVLRKVESGRYYVDMPSWNAARNRRQHRVLLAVIVVLVAALIPLLFL